MSKQSTAWNNQILSNPDGGNIFQSFELAEQKRSGGWTPRYLELDQLALTVLEKSVPLLGKIWYLPKGPGVDSLDQLSQILPGLKQLAHKAGVFAVKIEPELKLDPAATSQLNALGLVKTTNIQPNFSTVLVDLSVDTEQILMGLPQKGRHAIRRAEREGVSVEQVEASDANCQIMYSLLADTAAGSFMIRPYSYYQSFWQKFAAANLGQMFFAYYEGRVIAGAYALTFGAKSTYKDGASIREKIVYGGSHLLQWEVIKWAKSCGSDLHDLCGTPPAADINDPQHPHYGLGRFKTSFNKTVTDYVGTYDLVVKPQAYQIWTKLGERIVKRLHWQKHRQSYY